MMRGILALIALAIGGASIASVTPLADRCDAGGATPVAWKVETVARGLEVPWALAFSADGKIFFTERPGRISVIDSNGATPRVLARLPDIARSPNPEFATGLLGLALDPNYPRDRYLYVYYTYDDDGRLFNRLVRFRETGDSAVADSVVLDRVPGSSWQNGGRIQFGPDGKLYVPTGAGEGGPRLLSQAQDVTTAAPEGQSGRDEEAQDVGSLVGKILRLNRDGTIPRDNPFPGFATYSYGHRNPQGLAWHPVTGTLYNTEHGPPGGWDEVNRVERGDNHGWPLFKGATISLKLDAARFQAPRHRNVKPVAVYVPAVGPSGATFYAGKRFPQWTNSLFVATLVGRGLHRIELAPDGIGVRCQERLVQGEYGRLRSVAEGPDGLLYFSTSVMDQDWKPGWTEDRILRIVPR